MGERTVTLTIDEFKELIEISERYCMLKEMHRNDKYLSKEDKVLYNINDNINESSESEG